jgi:ABC transporter substrate binding protein
MRRREFIGLLGGAAVVWPIVARAQHPERVRRIGGLWGADPSDPQFQRRFGAFNEALKELGWVQGKNFVFENRYAIGQADAFFGLAEELVGAKVDVIMASNAGLAMVAHKASSVIPIIVTVAGDLEESGLIATLGRPGGSVTGLQSLNPELMEKRIEYIKELVPNLVRFGVIEPVNQGSVTAYTIFSSDREHSSYPRNSSGSNDRSRLGRVQHCFYHHGTPRRSSGDRDRDSSRVSKPARDHKRSRKKSPPSDL